MNMKKILAVLCVAALAVVSVLGTLAYLTSQDSVTNTFTVGEVQIKLDETAVDEYGKSVDGAGRVKDNEYKLIPGSTYVKDPTVTVLAGSEESYVRMFVTINKADELKAIFGADFLPQNYVEGWDADVWVPKSISESEGTLTYEFWYNGTVDGFNDAGEAADVVLPALFKKFTLPGIVTGDQLKTLEDLKIEVVGHAIQAANFADAAEAWEGFDDQMSMAG